MMGHISPAIAKRLVDRGSVEVIELENSEDMGRCESCEHAKAMRKHIRKEREEPRVEKFGDKIRSDLWGPSPVETLRH